MSELGVRLQTAREEKGFSLEELQQRTKIQKRYLVAIEEGDFSKMPGEFYARAFVKRYCEAVGLDSELIFDEHHNELPKPKQEKADLPPRMERERSQNRPVRRRSTISSLMPSIVVFLFLIAIVVGVWFMQQDGDGESGDDAVSRDDENSPSVEITDNIEEEEENNEDEENNEEKNENNDEENNNNDDANNDGNNENNEEEEELSAEEVEGTTTTYTLTGADEMVIDLEFTGESWVNISNEDGEDLHESVHNEGDEANFDFSDEQEITFNIGNTYGTEIYVNEESLEYERDDTDHQYIVIQFDDAS